MSKPADSGGSKQKRRYKWEAGLLAWCAWYAQQVGSKPCFRFAGAATAPSRQGTVGGILILRRYAVFLRNPSNCTVKEHLEFANSVC